MNCVILTTFHLGFGPEPVSMSNKKWRRCLCNPYGPFLRMFMACGHQRNQGRKRGWDVGLLCSGQKWLSNQDRRSKHVNHKRGPSISAGHSFVCGIPSRKKKKEKKTKTTLTRFLLLEKRKTLWLIKIRRVEDPQLKPGNGVDRTKACLGFDHVTRRNGQCTIHPRFRSRDPPWPVSLWMVLRVLNRDWFRDCDVELCDP